MGIASLQLGTTQCVSAYDILQAAGGASGMSGGSPLGGSLDGGEAGSADSGGVNAGGQNSGWTAATCFEALARGVSGQACSGSFRCEGTSRDCCTPFAYCSAGRLSVGATCGGCECITDRDCGNARWCINNECEPCAFPDRCAMGVLVRNGCYWCIPYRGCSTDRECDASSTCYPGRACLANCSGASTCCFGNVCAAPGCGSTEGLDCAVVGCPAGFYCNVVDPEPRCECDQGLWTCSPASGNSCEPL